MVTAVALVGALAAALRIAWRLGEASARIDRIIDEFNHDVRNPDIDYTEKEGNQK